MKTSCLSSVFAEHTISPAPLGAKEYGEDDTTLAFPKGFRRASIQFHHRRLVLHVEDYSIVSISLSRTVNVYDKGKKTADGRNRSAKPTPFPQIMLVLGLSRSRFKPPSNAQCLCTAVLVRHSTSLMTSKSRTAQTVSHPRPTPGVIARHVATPSRARQRTPWHFPGNICGAFCPALPTSAPEPHHGRIAKSSVCFRREGGR